MATGQASHAFLGVALQDLSPGLAAAFGLPSQDGTLIAMVTPDSPAADAGLRAGDVITAFNGKAIGHFGDLSQRIGDAMPGQSVRLSIWRKHRASDFMVKFGRIRDPARLQGQPLPEAPPGEPGLTLRKLTVRELAITELPSGMLIEQVAGPAARAGLLPGDVLLAINGDTTQTLKDVQAALHGKPERMALLIQRGSDRMFVPVALP
jgi:serine protease Do